MTLGGARQRRNGPGAENAFFIAAIFNWKSIVLPRQARDKHTQPLKTRGVFLIAGSAAAALDAFSYGTCCFNETKHGRPE